jgi:hypothetical protein
MQRRNHKLQTKPQLTKIKCTPPVSKYSFKNELAGDNYFKTEELLYIHSKDSFSLTFVVSQIYIT